MSIPGNATGKPDISVIIPTHNTLDLVSACIESIVNYSQDLIVEIIVVDDASSDGTLKHIKAVYPQCKTIHNPESLGYGGAANRGLAVSTGHYLVVSNSDVQLQKDTLQKLIVFAQDHTDCGVVAPMLLNSDNTLQRSISRHPSIISNFVRLVLPDRWVEGVFVTKIVQKLSAFFGWNPGRLGKDIHTADPLVVECVMGAFFMLKREAYTQTNGFDSDSFYLFTEEADWFMRIQRKGWNVYYLPDTAVIHHGSKTVSQRKHRYYIQQYKSYLRFYEKHKNLLTVSFYKLVLSPVFFTKALFYGLLALISNRNRSSWLCQSEANAAVLRVFFRQDFRRRNVMTEKLFRYIK